MTTNGIYNRFLKIAIENKVGISVKAYEIAKIGSILNIDKCVEHMNDNRYCICKQCLLDIQKNGKCDSGCFRKV